MDFVLSIKSIKHQYWRQRARWLEICDEYSPESVWAKVGALRASWRREVVEIGGVKLRLERDIPSRLRTIIYRGFYEQAEREIVKTRLMPDDVVLELGTGIGLIASSCALKIGSNRVHTFEANPALIPRIKETFQLNGVSPILHNYILGEGEAKRIFYVTPEFWSSSTIKRRGKSSEVSVEQKDFNSVLREIQPTFLIVDIEGGEFDLFQYADLQSVRKLAIELHARIIGPERTGFVVKRIEEQGLTKIPESCVGDEQLYFERRS